VHKETSQKENKGCVTQSQGRQHSNRYKERDGQRGKKSQSSRRKRTIEKRRVSAFLKKTLNKKRGGVLVGNKNRDKFRRHGGAPQKCRKKTKKTKRDIKQKRKKNQKEVFGSRGKLKKGLGAQKKNQRKAKRSGGGKPP